MNKKQILIAGGGITGLTTAYYLQKHISENSLPYEIRLIEQSDHLGGKIRTELVDGFVIEKGPDSFLARKPAVIELTKELGLEQELVGTNPQARKNYILHKNRLHLMPPGLILGIPTQVGPFVQTGLISPLGKLRAAFDLFIKPREEEGDESLGHFLKRRLGREVAQNIAEPLLSGIYAGDTDVLSLEATFPQFKSIEDQYGSIIKGMLQSRKKSNRPTTPQVDLPEIAKKSMFLNYKQGLMTIVNRLKENLIQAGVSIQLEKCVQKITPQGKEYLVELDDDHSLKVHAVILATPAHVTKKIISDVEEAALLSEITYVSVANVALAFDRNSINYPLDASGFVVPRNEGRNITACTWTSSKWPHTTPENRVLLRCYVGHSKDQSLAGLPEDMLLARVREDLKDIMGLTAEPLFYRITRWKNSMPQYRVGHLDRLQTIREALKAKRPGMLLTGAGYQGVGIPDCIQQGKDSANQMASFLMNS